MKFTVNKLACAVQALAALLLLGAVKLWAPVCGKMLTLTTGKEVHMKCFYTGQTAVVLAVIMLAVALLVILPLMVVVPLVYSYLYSKKA